MMITWLSQQKSHTDSSLWAAARAASVTQSELTPAKAVLSHRAAHGP